MIKVGDYLSIRGNEVYVCFECNYKGNNYICTALETDKIIFEIYKYKEENDKLLVCKVEDEDELANVTAIFLEESIDEFGIPEDVRVPLLNFLNDNN